MKFSPEKILLLFIPYLLVLSIFYNNGYWSIFSFNIFNYYEAQDIVKDIAGPLFKFGGLLIVPLFLAVLATASILKKDKDLDEKNKQIAEEFKNEWKNLSLIKKLIYIAKVLVFSIFIIVIFLLVVFAITIIFYPIEDDGSFVIKYLYSLNDYSLIRFFYVMIFVVIGTIFVTKQVNSISKIDSGNIGLILMSIILTTMIAYHYGKIEAYKVVSGTSFRYWIDKRGVGHKYVAKVNKNYLFSNDVKFINPDGTDYALDTLKFDSRILVVSEDSLKSIELGLYEPSTYVYESKFEKAFTSRNEKNPH